MRVLAAGMLIALVGVFGGLIILPFNQDVGKTLAMIGTLAAGLLTIGIMIFLLGNLVFCLVMIVLGKEEW